MNPERLQLKGMLAESKKNFRTLDTEASGLVILIRALLNPYEDIKNLDMDKVLVTVQRLKEVSEEMRTLSEKIKRLESEFEQ
ncbi:unknown [Fusobacterium sp. CAG:439]|nr:unknown [Fusobacterium sp. CAG:439]